MNDCLVGHAGKDFKYLDVNRLENTLNFYRDVSTAL